MVVINIRCPTLAHWSSQLVKVVKPIQFVQYDKRCLLCLILRFQWYKHKVTSTTKRSAWRTYFNCLFVPLAIPQILRKRSFTSHSGSKRYFPFTNSGPDILWFSPHWTLYIIGPSFPLKNAFFRSLFYELGKRGSTTPHLALHCMAWSSSLCQCRFHYIPKERKNQGIEIAYVLHFELSALFSGAEWLNKL